ncbi:hypothetical protein M426DRAFT_17624 [Hypoxylon sp. CI-4A]|nr:hypothetical protein M426DRAFT_17624 [Hypoxylon sp. CI-4A]
MDPVSTISVVAAAVQFTEIAVKITKRIAVFTVSHNAPGHGEGPRTFVENLRSQLGLLNSTVRQIEEGLSASGELLQDNELLDLNSYISNLNRHGQKLDSLLDKYLPSDDASTPVRLLAALKSVASDIEIESVKNSINELLPLLTTFLLSSMVFRNGFIFSRSNGSKNTTQPNKMGRDSDTIYQVSRHQARYFIDRPELLSRIDRLLRDQQTQHPRIGVIQGMGGQGKT